MNAQMRRKPLIVRLEESLEEGIRFARGELRLRTSVFPAPAPEITARDVIELRQRFQMSQAVFARLINVSSRTIQRWECGKSQPSDAALRLFQVLRHDPQTVLGVLRLSG